MATTDLEVVPGHIETPDSIELKASAVASPYIGACSLWPIVKDTVFGPFVGDIKKGKDVKDINSRHACEVFDLDTFDLLHVIDATDPSKGNWMRYVNCARYFEEQNIISVQQEDQVHYKAIKNIKPGEELLTWFEPRKKKRQHKWKMEEDVKEEKKTSPHSCEYCGKGFPSLSNLKKHVRFHLGYRMNCLYCDDIHENVGGHKKHIRIAHPEVHKAKLKNKLAKDGVLRKPDRKVVDKKSKASKIKDGIKNHIDNMDSDKQKILEKKRRKILLMNCSQIMRSVLQPKKSMMVDQDLSLLAQFVKYVLAAISTCVVIDENPMIMSQGTDLRRVLLLNKWLLKHQKWWHHFLPMLLIILQ